MTLTVDPTQLRPVLTGAPWAFEWEFYIGDPDTPDVSVTASEVAVTFAPARVPQPASSDVHVFTSGEGGGVGLPAAHVIRPDLDAAATTGWKAGHYLVEVRVGADVVYLGTVLVARTLSELPTYGGGGEWPIPGLMSGRIVVSQPDGRRILRDGSLHYSVEARAAADAAAAEGAAVTGAELKAATFAAAPNRRYLLDSTAAGFIATLPGSPAAGDAVVLEDCVGACGAHPVVVQSDVHTVDGAADDWLIDVAWAAVRLTFTGSTWFPRRY